MTWTSFVSPGMVECKNKREEQTDYTHQNGIQSSYAEWASSALQRGIDE